MIRLDCRPNYFVVSSDVLKADLFSLLSYHTPQRKPTTLPGQHQN